jgi:Spy/CpxP family protein refolding chaperone
MNKTSKLIALATFAVAVVVPATWAQDSQSEAEKPKAPRGERGERAGPGGGRPMAEMIEQLNLTEDQKPKFEAAWRTRGEKMRDLRDNSSLDEDARRAKMQEIMQNFRREVDSFLTAEQKTKLSDLQERMRNRRGGPGGGKGEGAPRREK